MKKLVLFFSTCILLVSCASQIEESAKPSVLNHVSLGVADINLDDLDAETKSSIAISNTVSFTWSADDTVGIFPASGSQAYFSMESNAGQSSAVFDGGGWALKASHEYCTYAPYKFKNTNSAYIPFDFRGQKQVGKNNYDHLAKYQYLGSGSKNPEEGSCDFTLVRLEAVVIFQLTVPIVGSFSSMTIKTSDNSDLVVSTNVSIKNDTPVITAKDKAKRFTLDLEDVNTTTANEVIRLYSMLPPQNLSNKKLIICLNSTEGDCCQQEVDGKDLAYNSAYGFKATLSTDFGSNMEKISDGDGKWSNE